MSDSEVITVIKLLQEALPWRYRINEKNSKIIIIFNPHTRMYSMMHNIDTFARYSMRVMMYIPILGETGDKLVAVMTAIEEASLVKVTEAGKYEVVTLRDEETGEVADEAKELAEILKSNDVSKLKEFAVTELRKYICECEENARLEYEVLRKVKAELERYQKLMKLPVIKVFESSDTSVAKVIGISELRGIIVLIKKYVPIGKYFCLDLTIRRSKKGKLYGWCSELREYNEKGIIEDYMKKLKATIQHHEENHKFWINEVDRVSKVMKKLIGDGL